MKLLENCHMAGQNFRNYGESSQVNVELKVNVVLVSLEIDMF